MKHNIAASARAIGSRVRRSLDFGFFVGFGAVVDAWVDSGAGVAGFGAVVGAGFGAVVEAWVDSVAGFAADFALFCLKKAYTFVTASFNFMLPPCEVYMRKYLLNVARKD